MDLQRIVCFLGLTLLSGCLMSPEPAPHVVQEKTEEEWTVPEPAVVPPQKSNPFAHVPPAWIPARSVERQWDAIVIHHSGTPNGNAEIFDRWHREGNHWKGVGYDFVIGNGTNSADGSVEVTFRWHQQVVGAHCKTPDNWANETSVGICLVGNFNDRQPTPAQMTSLRKLVHFLQSRYRIPRSRVYTHQDTPGAIVTDCPGRLFQLEGIAQ